MRDIKRKKTVTVKAGHSYLARAQRAASKSNAPLSAVGGVVRHARTRTPGRPLAGRGRRVPALSALAATPAHAADGEIDGSPLNVAADDTGFLQVTFDGSATGEFTPRPAGLALAGLTACAPGRPADVEVHRLRRHGGLPFTRTGAQPPTVTGDGSVGRPVCRDVQLRRAPGPDPDRARHPASDVRQRVVRRHGDLQRLDGWWSGRDPCRRRFYASARPLCGRQRQRHGFLRRPDLRARSAPCIHCSPAPHA